MLAEQVRLRQRTFKAAILRSALLPYMRDICGHPLVYRAFRSSIVHSIKARYGSAESSMHLPARVQDEAAINMRTSQPGICAATMHERHLRPSTGVPDLSFLKRPLDGYVIWLGGKADAPPSPGAGWLSMQTKICFHALRASQP